MKAFLKIRLAFLSGRPGFPFGDREMFCSEVVVDREGIACVKVQVL
jgi:hypothetical protein